MRRTHRSWHVVQKSILQSGLKGISHVQYLSQPRAHRAAQAQSNSRGKRRQEPALPQVG